jgi:hypothetical protein
VPKGRLDPALVMSSPVHRIGEQFIASTAERRPFSHGP